MLPTIVLLPGMDGTGELFQAFLAALKDEFTTIVVQYPTERTLTYLELTSLAASHLPTGTPFVVLAESFSGPVAISLATSKPRGLVGLILCASFARNPRPWLGYLIPILGWVPKNWMSTCVINFFFLGDFSTMQVANDFHRVFSRLNKAVLVQRLRLIVAVDVVPEVERVDVPLLYLMATKDRLISNSAAKPFEKLIKCQICRLDGPHLLLQSVPEDAARVVKVFLNSLAKSHR
jgi:pimeloyl-ACP methyl ester carboxylesterase